LYIKSKPQWSQKSLAEFMQKEGQGEGGVKYLMTMRLIAKRTEAVGKQIFYPFIVLSLILIARTHYFDDWRASIHFIALLSCLGLLYTWSVAVTLRRQAEKTRKKIIDDFSKKLIQAVARDPKDTLVEQLKFVLEEIKKIDQGAFAPLTQQPLLRALLVPFGLAGVQLFNMFNK